MVFSPVSLTPKPLSSFRDFKLFKLFEDHFESKGFIFLTQAKTKANSRFNFLFRGGKRSYFQEMSLQFPFNREKQTAWLGLRNQNEFKVHLDLGEVDVTDHISFSSIFANLKFERPANYNFRVGVVSEGSDFTNITRLSVKSSGWWAILNRVRYDHPPYVVASINEFNPIEQLTYRSEHLFGYQTSDLALYVRHYSNVSRSYSYNLFSNFFQLGRLHFNLISRSYDHMMGIEFQIDQNKSSEAAFVLQKKIFGIISKAKLDISNNLLHLSARGSVRNWLSHFFDLEDDKIQFTISTTSKSFRKTQFGLTFQADL